MKRRLLVCFLCSRLAGAQEFELHWTTVDGGGVQDSTGGEFQLSATIGQPDAGASSGDGFALGSGFWSGITDEPGWIVPSLRIGAGPDRPHVYWPAAATNWTLQAAPDLRGAAWQDSVDAPVQLGDELAVPVDAGAPSLHYRLRRQP